MTGLCFHISFGQSLDFIVSHTVFDVVFGWYWGLNLNSYLLGKYTTLEPSLQPSTQVSNNFSTELCDILAFHGMPGYVLTKT
jgi:hypothetical protein